MVCQLDILKRLDFAADIRVALSQLPKTLDETYERILGNIPSESQVLARKTLHLLSSGYVDALESLLHLLAVDLDCVSYSKENRPLDRYAPIEVCTCLVTYNDVDDTIRLAHYSVNEYIMSPRIAKGPASLFHATLETLDFLVARCLIIFLLDADYGSDTQLMDYAISVWGEIALAVKSEPSKRLVQTLILKLLDPTRSHFQNFVTRLRKDLPPGQQLSIYRKAAQGNEVCIRLAYLCRYGFIETAEILLEQQTERVPFESPLMLLDEQVIFLGAVLPLDDRKLMNWVEGGYQNKIGQGMSTLVHIAAMLDSTSFLDLFISKGADLNVKSPPGFSIWVSAVGPGLQDNGPWAFSRIAENCQDFVSVLVANNVSPNLSEVSITPLQMAIRQHASWSRGTGLFVRLLAAGAAVNGVADDKANLTRICNSCHWYFHERGALESNAERQSFIETALHRRGNSWLYDTPLRILDNKIKDFKRDRQGLSAYKNMLDIRMLLESNGAKSLHLFPIMDLPGYCNEDMEEWLGSGSNERNSQSLSSNFPHSSSFGQGTYVPGRIEELDDSTADEFEDSQPTNHRL